jgi:hypothetical protein
MVMRVAQARIQRFFLTKIKVNRSLLKNEDSILVTLNRA